MRFYYCMFKLSVCVIISYYCLQSRMSAFIRKGHQKQNLCIQWCFLFTGTSAAASLCRSPHTHTHTQLATHMQNRAHVYSCAFMHTLAHSRRGVGRGLLDSRAGAFLAIMGQLDRTHTHKFPLYRKLKCRVRPLKLRKGCFCRTHPKPHWGLICRVIQSDLLVKTKTISFIDSDYLCKLHKILKKLECSFYPQLDFIGFLYM